MQRMMENAGHSWARVAGPDERYAAAAPDLLAGVTAEGLRHAMQDLLVAKPVTGVLLDHVAPVRISVRDAVDELLAELPRAGRMSFGELAGDLGDRLQVIVRFLALLELYKRGLVDLNQVSPNDPLEVWWLADELRAGDVEAFDIEEYQG
jgi:segregation and condensation protein A